MLSKPPTHLDGRVHHKVKQLPHSQRGHAGAPEEVVDVLAVCGWAGGRWMGRLRWAPAACAALLRCTGAPHCTTMHGSAWRMGTSAAAFVTPLPPLGLTLPQEVECARVVQLHRLAHVDAVQLVVVHQHVVLCQGSEVKGQELR